MIDDTRSQVRHTALEIADMLGSEIRVGAIAQSAPIPTERELCERFGASRPTVREALMNLQMRGFISAEAGKRPRATRPSLTKVIRSASEHLRDILGDAESGAYLEQMRQFIEAGAVREAARHATSVHIARIKTALDANAAAVGKDEFSATDIAFHLELVSVLGNPVVLTLHEMFVSEVLKLRPRAADRVAADQRTFEEHAEIYQAILDGNAERASELLDSHLLRSYRKRMATSKPV